MESNTLTPFLNGNRPEIGEPQQPRTIVADQELSFPIPKKRTIFFAVDRNPEASNGPGVMMEGSNSDGYNFSGQIAENRDFDEVTGNMDVLEVRNDLCINCEKPIVDDNDGIKCSRNPSDGVDNQMNDLTMNEHADSHKLCASCVIQATTFAVCKNQFFAGGGVGLVCMDPLCSRLFLVSEMHHFLPPEIESELQDRILQHSMEAFCRENPTTHLYKCTMCGLPDLIEEFIRFHECQRCKTYRCWICGRLATKAHEIRSCEEMDQAIQRPSRGFLFYNSQMLKPPCCG
uniref:Uncharacterized protein n=1 Tax=Panagrolaimus superbus TaxID=310955 RepID=A0A914YEF5_9BILA